MTVSAVSAEPEELDEPDDRVEPFVNAAKVRIGTNPAAWLALPSGFGSTPGAQA
jgi:hypothetical protein